MDWGKISYWSRKIHRWSLFFVVIFGCIQLVTGLILKYPQLFPFINDGSMLTIHIWNAGYFALAFSIQMMTGLIMYGTPWLLKTFRKPPESPTR